VARRLAVSQAQYPVFAGFGGAAIPYAGVFHTGGIVPGPRGAPRILLAQGGEVVTPEGEAGGDIYVDVYIGGEKIDERVAGQIRDEISRARRRTGPTPNAQAYAHANPRARFLR
jgi:hypothetical protein